MIKRAAILAGFFSIGIMFGQKLNVRPNLPSPQPVGTTVVWTATTTAVTNPLYQFSVIGSDGHQVVIQDYSGSNTLSWTTLHEGSYQILCMAVDVLSGKL